MTKMEHYKKRLIQQHGKPTLTVSPNLTSEEEDNSLSRSPTNLSRNSSPEKMKEDVVHSKVARKRAVCRSKFRHQNMELFKLGTSIPTSLCKTKEPYNVCTGKNLQLCYQNQSGKKCDENTSITESIIHTMEGNKRKDMLRRSVFVNNEKSEKLNKSSNTIDNDRTNNSGRHSLPAIVPEIPDRRQTSSTVDNKTSTSKKIEKTNRKGTDNLVIHKAEPVRINKRKTVVVKRRNTVIGIENSESEVQGTIPSSDAPSREAELPAEPATPLTSSSRRKSLSTESEISENSPINLSLKNNEPSVPQVQVTNIYNDPRLFSKQSQYLKQILPNQYNTPTQPPASHHSHEYAKVVESSPHTLSPETYEPARNYVTELTKPPSVSLRSHESTRKYIPEPVRLSAPLLQNHESTRNYVVGPSKPPGSSENHEPARSNAVGATNHDSARNYFAGPSTSNNAPHYQTNYGGANFPEIHRQMVRLESPNAPSSPQKVGVPRPEQNHSEAYPQRSLIPSIAYSEDVIKSIIRLVKSIMEPSFTVEILLTLNTWYVELKSCSIEPTVSTATKMAIRSTLNDIILYISEKIFGVPCNPLLRSYVEQMTQVITPHHKQLLTSLLPLLSRNYNNEQWMCSIIKLLSQSLPPPTSSDARNQGNSHPIRGPVIHTQSDVMYSVPVTSHNYPHPHPLTASQNYHYQNYQVPQPLPYQAYHYQHNLALQETYPSNMDRRRNGLGPYVGSAVELERHRQNMHVLYQNPTMHNFPRPENFGVPVATQIRPDMYLVNNRPDPPPYGANMNLEQQVLPEKPKTTRYRGKNKNKPNTVPNTLPPTSTATTASIDEATLPTPHASTASTNKPNLQRPCVEKTTVTNAENSSQDSANANKNQRNEVAAKQNNVISGENSETSTCSSGAADHCPVSDVEELLQTNVIFNKAKGGDGKSKTNSAIDETAKNLRTEEPNNENVTPHAVNDLDNNQLDQEGANIDKQVNNNNNESSSVSSTVIVKDKSMEITRDGSLVNVHFEEPMDDKNFEESDIILEKVNSSQECDDITSTSTSSESPIKNRKEIKDELKYELYEFFEKTKQKLQLSGDNSPGVKLQISKYFGPDFKEQYEVMFSISKKEHKTKLEVPNEVITIDDDEDIPVENVPDTMISPDDLPKLIKLPPLKRKEGEEDSQKLQKKKLKTTSSSARTNIIDDDVVIVEDEVMDCDDTIGKIEDDQSYSDCNQNYITVVDQDMSKDVDVGLDEPKEEPDSAVESISTVVVTSPTSGKLNESASHPVSSITIGDVTEETDRTTISNQSPPSVVLETPAIEDISSDEETFESFRLHNFYENNISDSMIASLDALEVSHCTLINRSVDIIRNASNRVFFEKPLVYTRPVMPRKVGSDITPSTSSRNAKEIELGKVRKSNCLANIIEFEKDSTAISSIVNVQPSWDLYYSNPKNTEERDFPLIPACRLSSVSRTSPLTPTRLPEDNRHLRVSPITSPNNGLSPNFRSPRRSVPSSTVVPPSPLVSTAPAVVSVSPLVPATPSVVLATTSVVPATTSVVQTTTTAVASKLPELNNSKVSWQNWFVEEKRKGFFNFGSSGSGSLSRRQSLETISSVGSDYENYYEIKVDSKPYRIKRSLYEKIPKGKLCYIRENNTFIRYFDDGQMELFIRNLSAGEGSSIASELLKQIKGRVEGLSDVETSLSHYEASGKSEVITISKDVTFSTEDYLSDPELYVEEVEKVQLYVPRDFYGFYKYVTGYQIVNHHPPISFQTFLIMHNTNGIKGLFKSYVNTLIEGQSII